MASRNTDTRKTDYRRPQASLLAARLREPRRFIQVVSGPRQVGKTTLVGQVAETLAVPVRSVTADEPSLRGAGWIAQQWEAARLSIKGAEGAVLVLDEIQKIPGWSETVKRLWDEDTQAKRPLKVVVLGSAPLLLTRGLTESLTGRFETITLSHWSLGEMRDAFGYGLEDYLYFGGYPGAVPLKADPTRWARYIQGSIIETTVARDVLLLTRVDKPALLRRLFEFSCRYSGQILSYTKMLGQLQDKGNTTTLAHYLSLLAAAGMVCGLPKYTGQFVRRRGSSPKLQVLNTALMTAGSGMKPAEIRDDPEFRGRLVESAVGAHLCNGALQGECEVYYWRERNHEVDFVVQAGRRLIAIEVKSGKAPQAHPGMALFARTFKPQRRLLVGGDGLSVEEFLSQPVSHWA